MTSQDIRALVLRALGDVAPELNLDSVDPGVSLRDQYDLDSVDFLNFIVALHTATAVEIPESDYPQLTTLDDCVAYIGRALAGRR